MIISKEKKLSELNILKEQKQNPEINVFTGSNFIETGKTATGASGFDISMLTEEQKMQLARIKRRRKIKLYLKLI